MQFTGNEFNIIYIYISDLILVLIPYTKIYRKAVDRNGFTLNNMFTVITINIPSSSIRCLYSRCKQKLYWIQNFRARNHKIFNSISNKDWHLYAHELVLHYYPNTSHTLRFYLVINKEVNIVYKLIEYIVLRI